MPRLVDLGLKVKRMSDRSSIAARLLLLCWLIAIVGGFFASLVMSIQAFRDGNTTSGMVLGAIAIGCAVLCYRTYVARDQLRT
jgi:formate/nitrite transporter FocA (FNT family)